MSEKNYTLTIETSHELASELENAIKKFDPKAKVTKEVTTHSIPKEKAFPTAETLIVTAAILKIVVYLPQSIEYILNLIANTPQKKLQGTLTYEDYGNKRIEATGLSDEAIKEIIKCLHQNKED